VAWYFDNFLRALRGARRPPFTPAWSLDKIEGVAMALSVIGGGGQLHR
jgi:hypothetical protein